VTAASVSLMLAAFDFIGPLFRTDSRNSDGRCARGRQEGFAGEALEKK